MSQFQLGQQLGQQGFGFGILTQVRATFFRIRSTARRPQYLREAARVVVKDADGAIEQVYIYRYLGDSKHHELYGYFKNGDLKAVLTVYFDAEANLYKYTVSKISPDSLTVEFDETAIGNLGSVTAIDTPATGQITHEAKPLTA